MADASELQVQLTLSISELKDIVALVNLASESLPEDQQPEVIGEVSALYFELMENLKDGILGYFRPE